MAITGVTSAMSFRQDKQTTAYSLCLCWLGLALMFAGGSAFAGEWRIVPRVSVNESYTDNVNLAASGLEDDDFITEVTPSISLRGQGGRLSANFDYSLQQLFYSNDSDRNSLSHQLQANANAELVKQILFLDVDASARQENTSNSGRLSDSNISVTGNRNEVYTWRISPVARHHFGNYANGEAKVTVDQVLNSGGGNSTSTGSDLLIDSGSRFSRLPWSLSYSQQRVDNESGTISSFERFNGTLRYVFNRKYSAFVNAGVENNKFSTSQDDSDGFSWDAGATWTPSSRTRLEAGYGERFFGNNYSFSLSHQSRRAAWTASYSEDITTTRQSQLDRQLIPLLDAFGAPILDPGTGLLVQVPVDSATITEEVLVAKQFQGGVTLRGRRTDASINVFNTQRDFQLSGGNETVFGGSASVSRQLSQRTTVSLSGGWQQSELAGGTREDQLWNAGVSMTRQFARDLSAQADYRRVQQESDLAANEYEENRFSLNLNLSF